MSVIRPCDDNRPLQPLRPQKSRGSRQISLTQIYGLHNVEVGLERTAGPALVGRLVHR